jgi:hypothetical protein
VRAGDLPVGHGTGGDLWAGTCQHACCDITVLSMRQASVSSEKRLIFMLLCLLQRCAMVPLVCYMPKTLLGTPFSRASRQAPQQAHYLVAHICC